ncbi:transcription antitermination factor NusB [Terracidiphilus sp.]|jgi:16S rRNA (cytosine967-C5)-methyltransferase|uniref:transcription antitermination factor NusB n=1 Tax=Terracidiphilus sp. TaxID=1964191 RepID=UPI003C236764
MAHTLEKISPARKAAFEVLLAVENGRGHSDDLLRRKSVSRLSASDKNLATALVLGVLRWQIALDDRIRPLLKRPNAKLDIEVLIALRLGVFQLLMMDRIPAHAAIDESVELAQSAGHRFASGMVNAVLRKLAAGDAGIRDDDPKAAYPTWMVTRWMRSFGVEKAETICRSGLLQPEMSVRIQGAGTEAELVDAGVRFTPGLLLTATRKILSGDVMAMEAFRDGRVRIQDEGSQLVAEIAGNGAEILDACAAPGGKTLILAERNPQAQMIACEVNPQRCAALRKRLASLGSRVECRQVDATELAERDAFDLVLADVPCSGTGTLGRNPEIRHRLEPEDFARQAERQRAILATALRVARRGAMIVYSTCSLEPEENEQVVHAVLAQMPGVRLVSLAVRVVQLREKAIVTADGAEKLFKSTSADGFLRLFPGDFGTDGFFIALMEKLA